MGIQTRVTAGSRDPGKPAAAPFKGPWVSGHCPGVYCHPQVGSLSFPHWGSSILGSRTPPLWWRQEWVPTTELESTGGPELL